MDFEILTVVLFLADPRYPLLGQPLQYNPQVRPPLLHAPPVISNHQVRPAKNALSHHNMWLILPIDYKEQILWCEFEQKNSQSE